MYVEYSNRSHLMITDASNVSSHANSIKLLSLAIVVAEDSNLKVSFSMWNSCVEKSIQAPVRKYSVFDIITKLIVYLRIVYVLTL